MNLPAEVNCDIFSYLRDPREIISFIRTSKYNYNIFKLCKDSIEVLEWNPNLPENHPLNIPISFILQFPNLRRVEIPVKAIIPKDLFRMTQKLVQNKENESSLFRLISLSKLEYIIIEVPVDISYFKDLRIIVTSSFFGRYYRENHRLIPNITINYISNDIVYPIKKFNHGLYVYELWGNGSPKYTYTLYQLMKLIDIHERLEWICELGLFENDRNIYSLSSLLEFTRLKSILYNTIYGSLYMLYYGNFNRIFLPSELWTVKVFGNISEDMFRFIGSRDLDNIVSEHPLHTLHKTFHLEIPCFMDYYYTYREILDYLGDVKTFAIFLDELATKEYIYNKEIFSTTTAQDLIDNYHPDKVIVYSILPYDEINPYYHQDIFEYRNIRDE
jgi:hypothetical protein